MAAEFTDKMLQLTFCVSSSLCQIPVQALVQFVEALECGYSKYKNPYHNLIHAADVTQTAHFLMLHTGLMVRNPPTHTHEPRGYLSS